MFKPTFEESLPINCLRTKSEYGRRLSSNGSHTVSPDFYYYMITVKNNNNPQTVNGFTTVRQIDELMIKIYKLAKCEEMKEAYELDSKGQIHGHSVVYSKKILNPIWLNKYIKRDCPEYKSWMINVSIIKDGYHLQNCINYLDTSQNGFVVAKYNYSAPSELASFLDF